MERPITSAHLVLDEGGIAPRELRRFLDAYRSIGAIERGVTGLGSGRQICWTNDPKKSLVRVAARRSCSVAARRVNCPKAPGIHVSASLLASSRRWVVSLR